ncbi:MAG: hypothetical protein R3229_12675 [Alphaproteobacteria bacterium]|nr:hypothetical protein [Alphaproteobacteria bacterium]
MTEWPSIRCVSRRALGIGSCLAVLAAASGAAAPAIAGDMPAAEAEAWAKSCDPKTKRRFIPVELWTGAPWSGKREIEMGKADISHDRDHTIRHFFGPKTWRHNVSGEEFLIYDHRIERKRRRARRKFKYMYFTVRPDKQGMGRVYDSRRTLAYLSPGAKFPLGYWTQGETRVLSATVMPRVYKETGGPPTTDPDTIDRTRTRTRTRLFEMTITQIDFTYEGIEHCLKFKWRAGTKRRTTQVYEYTYCPRRSMVNKELLGHRGSITRPPSN